MSTPLTPQQMTAIFQQHAHAEFVQDLDATMATVGADPVFEWVGVNLRVEGRDAVREQYSRIFRNLVPKIVGGGIRRIAWGENTMWGDFVYDVRENDGSVKRYGTVTIVTFDAVAQKVSGEFSYPQPGMAAHHREALGDDILDVPGITLLDHAATVVDDVPWTTRNTATSPA